MYSTLKQSCYSSVELISIQFLAASFPYYYDYVADSCYYAKMTNSTIKNKMNQNPQRIN